MRVLHIGTGNLYGGVETVLVTLARSGRLAPALHSEFALGWGGRAEAELRQAGATVHVLGAVRLRRPLSVLHARRALRDLIRRHAFDAIICHSAWSQVVFGSTIRRAGIASVFWLHDLVTGHHWLERWAARTPPDLAICNSQFTAESLPRVYPGVPAVVVYYPLEATAAGTADRRPMVREQLGVPADGVAIIQVSRMEPWKGHQLHIEALGRLARVPGWTCWMVGGAQRPQEARYLQSLQSQCTRLGIADRVRFLGQRSDVEQLVAGADVFCQPNTGPEPFGITFVEALYGGLPVIATAMGGALEIIDPSCGILVPPGDVTALAAALGRLISDADERTRLGAMGPSRARALCDPTQQLAALERALASGAIVRRPATPASGPTE
jgi:glycosyltransferase involved in cell wall biosynthesis